jgi:uncharacterized protein
MTITLQAPAARVGRVGLALAIALASGGLACARPKAPKQDAARASLERQAKVCDGGSADACFVVAIRFERGLGAPVDLSTSRTAWNRACALGAARACAQLGFRLEHGVPYPQDLSGAARAYRRACDGDDPMGCYGHAEALYGGYDGAREPAQAEALWSRLCTGKLGIACSRLGDELAKGGHPAEALELWSRACGLGSRGACHKAQMLEQHAPGLLVRPAPGDTEL